MKIRIALALLLLTSPAYAASRVSIAEFGTTRVEAPAPIATLPALVRQSIDISSGTAQAAQAFGKQTRYIRILCEVQCAFTVGQAATVNATMLAAGRSEYFFVTPGAVLSVIAAP